VEDVTLAELRSRLDEGGPHGCSTCVPRRSSKVPRARTATRGKATFRER
jgi:hypothetical protein